MPQIAYAGPAGYATPGQAEREASEVVTAVQWRIGSLAAMISGLGMILACSALPTGTNAAEAQTASRAAAACIRP
ncbi:MAG: hypothetical protein ACT4N3_13960, partial [Sphingosinicella sp.]